LSCWELRIFGRIELRDLTGKAVFLQNRRVAQVLTVLSQSRRYGVSREDLAQTVWPEVADQRRRASLRQALALLRKAIGEENLICTLEMCRLASGFRLETDLDHSSLRLSSQISPELDPRWLDQFLVEHLETATDIVEPCIFQNFYQVVLLTARYEQSRAVGMLKENLSLTHGLSPSQMTHLMQEVRTCHSMPGWIAFFQGYVRNYHQNSTHSTPHFTQALELSQKNTKDWGLGVQSAVQIAFSKINQGQFMVAEKMAEHCLQLAKESKDRNLLGTAFQALASVKINLGQTEAAFELFERSEQSYTNDLDSFVIRSIHNYYRASVPGAKSLTPIRSGVQDSRAALQGHSLTEWYSSAGPAISSVRDSHPLDSLPPLMDSLKLAEEMQNNHLTIFAMEALSRGYLRAGYVGEARSMVQKSRQVRGKMAVRHVFWDLVTPSK
jgi:DNA-binding winged helix-turn-helix (wHTH) protein